MRDLEGEALELLNMHLASDYKPMPGTPNNAEPIKSPEKAKLLANMILKLNQTAFAARAREHYGGPPPTSNEQIFAELISYLNSPRQVSGSPLNGLPTAEDIVATLFVYEQAPDPFRDPTIADILVKLHPGIDPRNWGPANMLPVYSPLAGLGPLSSALG